MQASAAAIDATLCPLCGAANRCALEVERETGREQPPCWCTKVDFTAELLGQLPAEALNLSCICAACAEKS
jgi:hypothetical protein